MTKLYILIIAIALMGCTVSDNSDAWGSLEAEEIIISARVNGNITQFHTQEGKAVESEALIAEIDATDLLLAKDELLSNIKLLEVKLQATEQKFVLTQIEVQNLNLEKERFTQLVAENASSQKPLDDINAAMRLLDQKLDLNKTETKLVKAEKLIANKKLKTLQNNIAKCSIYAPMKGTVLTVYNNVGEFVTLGKPILKLADIRTLKAVFYISETQLTSLKQDQKINIRIDSGDTMKSYPATVSYISDKAEFTPKVIQTREERVKLVYKVEAICDNDGSLKIGMPIEIIF
ncbi:MAG: HlyD family efflux transporter periplasmic adaptor subunit [Candidatus Zophobacter franzmannii]|nr:HlyD family efflux transporter periplasmic adaptor subunit [Candidatus Zophobacter franzmannii]